MPTEDDVRAALINVLREIQETSGHACPPLNDDVCPTNQLPGFDSLLCVESTVALEASLGVQFKSDNLFFGVKGERHTIGETVQVALGAISQEVNR